MSKPIGVRERLQEASDLKAVLAAAHDAFEFLLTVIRDHEDRADGMFAAFVMSAASAADGRDAVAAAPSLPPPRPGARAGAGAEPLAGAAADAAAGLADLSQLLATRLAQAASAGPDPGDGAACTQAARCAADIYELLTGTVP
jgi:hypothetical protein